MQAVTAYGIGVATTRSSMSLGAAGVLPVKRIVRNTVEHLCNRPLSRIVDSQQAVGPCVANRRR